MVIVAVVVADAHQALAHAQDFSDDANAAMRHDHAWSKYSSRGGKAKVFGVLRHVRAMPNL